MYLHVSTAQSLSQSLHILYQFHVRLGSTTDVVTLMICRTQRTHINTLTTWLQNLFLLTVLQCITRGGGLQSSYCSVTLMDEYQYFHPTYHSC